MTPKDDRAAPENENWADFIDRLSAFEAPTPRLRRAARKIEAEEAVKRGPALSRTAALKPD